VTWPNHPTTPRGGRWVGWWVGWCARDRTGNLDAKCPKRDNEARELFHKRVLCIEKVSGEIGTIRAEA
jgi:hypothetical protein